MTSIRCIVALKHISTAKKDLTTSARKSNHNITRSSTH